MRGFIIRIFVIALVLFIGLPSAAVYAITEPDDTPESDVLLKAIYTGQADSGATLTFNYPEAWEQDGDVDQGVVVATSMRPYYRGDYQTGDVSVMVMAFPGELYEFGALGYNAGPTLVLEEFVAMMEDHALFGIEIETVLPVEEADIHAASVFMQLETGEALMILVEQNGAYTLLIGFTANGESATYQELFLAMARTIQYIPIGDM